MIVWLNSWIQDAGFMAVGAYVGVILTVNFHSPFIVALLIGGFAAGILGLTEDESVFARADSLSDWANQFLLGLGLVQTELDKEKGEIGEAVDDLQDICQLGYDEEDDEEELHEALEEIIEYVRTIAMLFYTHFNDDAQEIKPILH